MSKFFFGVVILFLPFMVALGLVRGLYYGWGDGSTFLPTWEMFESSLASFPDFSKQISDAVSEFDKSQADMVTAFVNVHDLGSFFGAIGAFFNSIGKWFMVGGTVLSIPFQFVGWFIGFLFQGNPPTTVIDSGALQFGR